MMVYGVTNPTSYPRLFVTGVDLATLEAAWGKLARDHTGYATWWNPRAKLRAREGVPHPTPSKGRGLEIAPYTPLLDRVANLDELVIDGKSVVAPGEWDPLPITIAIDGKRLRFTTRVDAPPVDEAAVLAKLREIWGEPTLLVDGAAYGNGRVLVRRIEPQRVEITYVAP